MENVTADREERMANEVAQAVKELAERIINAFPDELRIGGTFARYKIIDMLTHFAEEQRRAGREEVCSLLPAIVQTARDRHGDMAITQVGSMLAAAIRALSPAPVGGNEK